MDYGFVKVGAYTPEIRVADTLFNAEQIIKGIIQADKLGVEVLVFPEMSITGYTICDLVYQDVLLDGAISSLKKVVDCTVGLKMLVFIGMPLKVNGLIYDVAIAINNGKVIGAVPKTYLSNVNEGQEKRYFSTLNYNTQITLFENTIPFGSKLIFFDKENKNLRVSVEVGSEAFSPLSPSAQHCINGATLIVNLFAGAETVGKNAYENSMVLSQSSRANCAYVLAQAGKGESTTDAVFGGHNIIAENGKLLAESKVFSTGLTVSDVDLQFIDFERSKTFNQNFDLDKDYQLVEVMANREGLKLDREFAKTPFVPTCDIELSSRAELILNMQAQGLSKRISHTNAKCVVLGISGGLDSTLALIVSVLAMKKLNRNLKDVVAVTMPCFGTTDRTFQNACKLTKTLGATLKKIDIAKSVTRHLKDLDHPLDLYDVTYENAQARERTQVIMDVANMNGGLVVGTGDLSELALGWATYNGDHMSMYGVNASIPKTLVRHLVEYYANNSRGKLKAILLDVLDTPVSPELLPVEDGKQNQQTEDIVGPYVLHDFYLHCFLRLGYSPKKIYQIALKTFKGEFDSQTIKKWLKTFTARFFAQQFKRSCLPDGVKVGSITFSPRSDWKMPSDAVKSLWQKQVEEL